MKIFNEISQNTLDNAVFLLLNQAIFNNTIFNILNVLFFSNWNLNGSTWNEAKY